MIFLNLRHVLGIYIKLGISKAILDMYRDFTDVFRGNYHDNKKVKKKKATMKIIERGICVTGIDFTLTPAGQHHDACAFVWKADGSFYFYFVILMRRSRNFRHSLSFLANNV